MYARSVLWSAKEINECIDAMGEEPKLRGCDITVDQSNRARTTLRELVEMIQTSSFHRPSNPVDRRDQPLEMLLTTMYERRSAKTKTITGNLPDGDQTLRSLKGNDQIEMKHGEIFVPLRGVGTAQNWPPVLRLLLHQFATLIEGGRDLVQKLRADGADSDSTEFILVQSLVDRLEEFRKVFRSHLSHLQLINYTVFVESHFQQFLVDVIPESFSIETKTTEEPL